MFSHVATFEWCYQLKSPVFWVGCAVFFLLTFGSVTVDQIQIGTKGAVNINSPFAIIQTQAVMSLFAVFVVVAMVAGTVIRDDETGFAPILRSTALGKGAHLGGRFAGSVAAALMVLACRPLAVASSCCCPSACSMPAARCGSPASGTAAARTRRRMVHALQGAFTFMPIIFAIFYAGELVWRDRERRLHEIVDATAAPDWAHLVPKIVAIALVLAATSAVGVLTGMALQLAKGYTRLEPAAYLLWFWLPTLISALQLAGLAVLVQVLVPQKFIGWGVMLLNELHVSLPERLMLDRFEMPGATLKTQYANFPCRIYALQPALQAGESRTISFTTTLHERGFPNGAPLTRIVENGSFLNNAEITPALGMSRDGLLTDRAKRRKYGLPPDSRPADSR